ncbi:MAG: class I SAM-dependent methyltransferase [Thermodesulfobacteriota bacterium]|jgi:ubiquinone/menaquinone biosynthesis C-methylase UbiE
MKNQIADIFDRHAEEYDEWFRNPKGRILFQTEVEAVRPLMIDAQPPFLEIGVGTGMFAAALHITFGVDPSYRVSSIAKKRGVLVASAKGEKLPFKDNTWGTIFILFTLCFVDDPMEVLEETYRLLKHGGKVILGIINKGSSWGKLYSNKKEKGDPFSFRAQFYSPDDV